MRVSEHPSAFELQRLSSGDLPASVRERVQAHVEGCEGCSLSVATLRTASARFLAQHPAELLLTPVLRTGRPPRPRALARRTLYATLAAAAVLTATVTVTSVLSREPIRLKGIGVSLHRNRAGDVRPLGADDGVIAGDSLRVVLTVAKTGRYMAWMVDARGRVDRALEQPALLEPGVHPLPGSLVMEAPCVDSWLVVQQLDGGMKEAEASLRSRMEAGASSGAAAPLSMGAGVEVRCE